MIAAHYPHVLSLPWLSLQLHRLFLALRDVYHRDIDPFVDNLLTVRLHLPAFFRHR